MNFVEKGCWHHSLFLCFWTDLSSSLFVLCTAILLIHYTLVISPLRFYLKLSCNTHPCPYIHVIAEAVYIVTSKLFHELEFIWQSKIFDGEAVSRKK